MKDISISYQHTFTIMHKTCAYICFGVDTIGDTVHLHHQQKKNAIEKLPPRRKSGRIELLNVSDRCIALILIRKQFLMKSRHTTHNFVKKDCDPKCVAVH